MICKICGKQLPEGSAVCKYCGAHVRSGGAPAKKPQRRYSKKGLARKRMINLIITLLALLLIGGVVAGVIWSAREASNKGKGDDQISSDAQTSEEQENEEEESEATEEEETIQQPEGSIVQQRPVDEQKPEQEEDQDQEQEELPGSVTETQPEDSQDTEVVPDQPTVQTPSGDYTISINRTETTASLNHYRELYVYINETLPSGVEIVETTWTSSNPNVVRADPGKAWGVSIGSATVTGTITLSDGQSLSATCKVNVVESQTQTPTQPVVTGDYVLADSSSRVYSAAELDALSDYQLWIARNEIYARHGRKFNNSELQTYFNGKSWYNGTIAADSFNESVLSSVEQQNVDAILAEEASR